MSILWKIYDGLRVPVLVNGKKITPRTLLVQPAKEVLMEKTEVEATTGKKRKAA